jgi:hypothetical protein
MFPYTGLVFLLGYWQRAAWWSTPADGVMIVVVIGVSLVLAAHIAFAGLD